MATMGVGLVSLALLGGTGPVRAEGETWQAALKLQVAAEKKCDLERIVSMRQLPVEGLDALEGRLRCLDGREFTFSRPKAHQKFTFQLCQPAVC